MKVVPSLKFMVREGFEEPFGKGGVFNPGVRFNSFPTSNYFSMKKVILIGTVGAFNPVCSKQHVPDYENNFSKLKELGIDEVYVTAVNDIQVMNVWKEVLGLENIKVLADGNGMLARKLGMLTDKSHFGYGQRSRRYVMYVVNGVIEKIFEEDPMSGAPDPYEVTKVENVISYLEELNKPEEPSEKPVEEMTQSEALDELSKMTQELEQKLED